MCSVLAEQELNVLEKPYMIKNSSYYSIISMEKKVRGLEIFRFKIADDAFFCVDLKICRELRS